MLNLLRRTRPERSLAESTLVAAVAKRPPDTPALLTDLAARASTLGREAAEVRGAIDDAHQQAGR